MSSSDNPQSVIKNFERFDGLFRLKKAAPNERDSLSVFKYITVNREFSQTRYAVWGVTPLRCSQAHSCGWQGYGRIPLSSLR